MYLNLAACYLHATHEDLGKVIENADLALAIHPDNAKALYRGGRAHLLRDDLDAAKTKLTRAAKLQPNDRAIREVRRSVDGVLVRRSIVFSQRGWFAMMR